jgi:hypothetical protein
LGFVIVVLLFDEYEECMSEKSLPDIAGKNVNDSPKACARDMVISALSLHSGKFKQ